MKTVLCVALAAFLAACVTPTPAHARAPSGGYGADYEYGVWKFEQGRGAALTGLGITLTSLAVYAGSGAAYSRTYSPLSIGGLIAGGVGLFFVGPLVTIAGGFTARSGARATGARVSVAWGVMAILTWVPFLSVPFALAQAAVAEKALNRGSGRVDYGDEEWDDEDWDDEELEDDWEERRRFRSPHGAGAAPWSLQVAPLAAPQATGLSRVLSI